MTRVLHIITRLILGGAQENTLYSALGQMRSPGIEATLCYGADDGTEGSLVPRARAAGLPLIHEPTLCRAIAPADDARCLVRLTSLMRRDRYDVVHTHSSKAGILGRVAARLAGTPVVVHTFHSLVFHEYQERWKNALYVALERMTAPLADALVSVNDRTTEGLLAAGVGRAEQYGTIYSGMALEQFLGVRQRLSVADAKLRLGIPADVPVVGKVARLFPLKGHAQFLDVASALALTDARVRFLLVGGGPLRAELAADAARRGLGDRVVFAGAVEPEAVPEAIQAMDVVVHTSLREGIARVLPQALAVGKPVVTFALDGAPEVVHPGVSGELVGAGDTAALAAEVRALLADPARCTRYGEAGRGFAAANFGLPTMVARINALYDRLLREKGRTPLDPAALRER